MLEAFLIFRHDWISNSQLQLIGALTVRNETLLLEHKKNGGNFGNSFVQPIFFNFIYIKKSSNNKDFFRKLGDLDKSSSFQND